MYFSAVVTTSPPRKSTLKLKARIAEPEVVVVEDMADPNCNAIVLTVSPLISFCYARMCLVLHALLPFYSIHWLTLPFASISNLESSIKINSYCMLFPHLADFEIYSKLPRCFHLFVLPQNVRIILTYLLAWENLIDF